MQRFSTRKMYKMQNFFTRQNVQNAEISFAVEPHVCVPQTKNATSLPTNSVPPSSRAYPVCKTAGRRGVQFTGTRSLRFCWQRCRVFPPHLVTAPAQTSPPVRPATRETPARRQGPRPSPAMRVAKRASAQRERRAWQERDGALGVPDGAQREVSPRTPR